MISFHFFLFIFSSSLLLANSESLYECPDENELIIIGSVWIDIPAVKHTSLIRRYRFPSTGLYDEVITCFMATDTSTDDSGGEVEITDGGLNHRYVELRLNSKLGKPLDYAVALYTNRKVNKNITQSFHIIN